MAVLAHAEKNQIENRLAVGFFWRNVANVHLGFFRGDFRRIFAVDAVDLRVVDLQRREQQFVRQREIAFRIVRRDAAFVRPEKMDEAEGDFALLVCATTDVKNFSAMRPPESATQCGLAA